ncbi:MAG: tetratricopeptide repeat protein [Nitrospinota bacterium]
MEAAWESLKTAIAGLPLAWTLAAAGAVVAFAVTVVVVSAWRAASRSRRYGREQRSQLAYVQGLNYMLSDQMAKAIEALSRAVKLDGGNVDAYLRLGTLFRAMGQPSRAIRIHKSLLLRPHLPEEVTLNTLYELGLDYRDAGDLEKAAKVLHQVTTLDAKHVVALRELRATYEQGHQWEEAVALEKKLLRVSRSKDHRGLASLHLAWGRDLLDQDQTDQALQAFHRAIKLDPQCVAAHMALGDALFETGQTKAAIEAWERLMHDSPPHFPFVLERLERAYFNIGQFDDLRRVYLRYLETYPDDATVRLALAEFYLRRGRLEEASKELETIGDDSLGAIKANLHLARIDRDQHREEAAWQARIETVVETVGALARTFRCRECQATHQECFWRCPACDRLDTAVRAIPVSGE